ncbi:hypothetical protein F7725_004566 [Dissostichus mawsoni]|uniref:Uncharacterized protein n=1 Tax=Dissostichus mawsoni TaxID=36200 RepID=A0A7J5XJ31_DISMA|nr:hypothetical protein F7725_004566 [Dissostichus mawsoni]
MVKYRPGPLILSFCFLYSETFCSCFSVALLLSLWSRAETAGIPDDETGAYAITQLYAAQCGYSINVHPLPGHVELRASYFSCQTQNKDDEMFTFNFNLNVTQEGKEVTYPLNKTCSPSLPWSPREVTCETNYMEVSVRSEVTCPSGTKKDDWNSLKPLPPMNISDARKQGYVFLLTEGRLVFRAPYGQPDSFSTERSLQVNGVPVEAVHATIFSRQSWVVLMVDLVAACSMGQYLNIFQFFFFYAVDYFPLAGKVKL